LILGDEERDAGVSHVVEARHDAGAHGRGPEVAAVEVRVANRPAADRSEHKRVGPGHRLVLAK
jgi:hypothetical protein